MINIDGFCRKMLSTVDSKAQKKKRKKERKKEKERNVLHIFFHRLTDVALQ